MKNFIFEKNYPSLSYIVNNWPNSKHILKKFVLSNQKKPDFYKLSIACLNDLNVHKTRKIEPILKKLSSLTSKNVTFNTYHDQHHFKSVVVIACLLAKLSGLKGKSNKILLVILALSHDLGHQGRRILKNAYYQEEKSYITLRRILFRKILNFKENQRIHRIFKSTYFPIKPDFVEDLIEKIILDADILASLMFGLNVGVEFARRLKHELRFEGKSDALFSGFLNFLNDKSLYLDSSKKSC